MMLRLITLFVLVFSPAVSSAEVAEAGSEQLKAQEIVDRAVARAAAQYESQVEALYEAHVFSSVQSLDDNNEVTNTELTKYRRYPIHGALYEELIEIDGRALSDKELREEEKRKQEFIREVEKRKQRGDHPQPENEPGIRFNQELMSRYRLKIEGTEVLAGHRCWVVTFEPKEDELPVRNRMDRALNQSTGTLYVSQLDYGVARIEFALRKPFKYWGGFLAVIRNTDGRLDYEQVESNVWLPSSFDLKLDLKVMMLKNIRRHITKKWTNYSPSSQAVTSSTPFEVEHPVATSANE